MFHPGWRGLSLDRARRPFDAVVLGAGITGCGIALDAAQRGLEVLLVDRGDVASGTSSRSSKLIHGGLRYLRQMQFRITRLACRERDRMLSLSPHLVRPVQFVYPAYHGDRTPGWQVDLGLWMYDRLTDRPQRHTQLEVEQLHGLAPGLETTGLDRALTYGDAMADDARLTFAVAASAHAHGAAVLTRAEVVGGIRDPAGRLTGVVLHDLESGRSLEVEAGVVVNASGVWTDVLRHRLGFEDRRLRPSRGAHVLLPREALALTAAVSFPSPDDGRPVFLVPHPEGVLLGTTDLYHDGELDDPRPSEAEIDYLLRAARAAFPGHGLGRHVAVGAFAGLRPILDTHAEDPSEASREEDVWEEQGLLSVAGGKLTTWRPTSEEAVDRLVELLGEERTRGVARCRTRGTPLAGLAPRDLGDRLISVHGLAPEIAGAMARRLGALAWPAVALADGPQDLEPIDDGLDLCRAELRAHLRWGAVVRLEDLLLRRYRIGMWDPRRARVLAPALEGPVRAETGWDGPRWQRELEGFEAALAGWLPPQTQQG